ncbi:MAG: glycerophosphodiester phosphodiesterase family protein [Cyanobacteria bacterium P01_F01_bin.86]
MSKTVDAVFGLKDNRYFIDVPEGEINTFFEWRPNFPELIAAHRGSGFLPGFPENVIASMDNSLRFGPTILEIDIQRTSDGVLILMHDDTLDRTTTGSGLVAETDWATIQTLHAVDSFGTPTSFKIPTLQETLEWGQNRALFALDLKADDFVAEVIGLVTDLEVEDDVMFFADNVEQMLKVYGLNPNIHFALLMTPDTREDLVNAVADSPISLESLTAFTVAPTTDPAYNQALHDRGIVSIFGAFIPEYELSEEDAISLYQHLIDQGVDSISTNRLPDLGVALGYEPQPAR